MSSIPSTIDETGFRSKHITRSLTELATKHLVPEWNFVSAVGKNELINASSITRMKLARAL
jgi:hypothetical protein